MIGKIISHYNVLEKLGGGGMGVVYKAEDTKLHRTVALKFLPSSFSFEVEAKQRFALEAQAASALQHNNICTIHEIAETEDGQSFIVMDYYDGKTLKDKIKKGPLNFDEFYNLSIQIAEGIAKAHKNGIIHRDIKPANIFITKEGDIKILDFGLAKLSDRSMLTKMGSTLGTAAYMSPEQACGEEVDHRTDIWSLGVIMYEMLTGQLPFKREYEQAIIYSILSEEVEPITSIRSEINPELDQLVLECLIKDQKNRCQSAAEICRKLKFMAGASGLAQYKTRSRKKIFSSPVRIRNKLKESPNRKWKWIAASIIAVMAIIIAFLIVRQKSQTEGIDLSKYKFTPIATDAEPESNPAWSPDGQNLAYLKVVNGYSQIFVRNIENPLPKQISFLEKQNAGTLFWSPDGNLIYFISEGNLYSIEAAGGEQKKIVNSVYAATISPDSRSIAYWDFEIKESEDSTQNSEYITSVFIYSLTDDSKRQYLPAPFEVFNRYDPNYIQFSPDGKKIALSIYGNNAESAEFWILPWPDGENSKPYKVFEELKFRDAPQFSWMPDSRNILISPQGSTYDDKMFIGDIETGKSYCIATPVSVKYNTGNVSPDGKKIAFTIGQDNLNIVRIPLDGSRPEWIITTSHDEYSLSFSNSGDKSIYITNKNSFDEIWLRNNGEDIKPIVTKKHFPDDEEYFLISANISPDGSQIAFIASTKKLGSKVYVMSIDGENTPRLLFGDESEQTASWSYDGSYLAVGKSDFITFANVATQEPPKILRNTNDRSGWIYWSPDRKWISYFNEQNIVLISPDGKAKKEVPNPGGLCHLMSWSKDGLSIYAVSSNSGIICTYQIDVNSGTSRKIGECKSNLNIGTDKKHTLFGCLTPDGKSIVTTAEQYKSDIWMMEGFPKP